ncbi:sulfatase [Roseiconus nitratireducens]|uniref:Sulfatase n=1 Tax=Roseiconus nitratireducens TaxID=2605748 RepID=A0A5M6DHV6_9BACT|nr:sulfatase [Roseiconus nitratireducens]KAA5545852.1 sulfatase [Roseiconus nitratireducens]
MSRFVVIGLLFTLTLAVQATAAERPNIVLMLCDDIRWNALSCAGHPHLKTPNIDRLADEGIYFENMFCTTSLCSPSRATILSGLYAHQHGVTNNFTDYPANLDSFPRRLQQSGYRTGYIGKWHMGEKSDEPRPGFDHFVTHKGQGKYFDTEFNFNGKERRVVPGYYTTVVTDMAIEWMKQQQTDDEDQPFMLMIGQKAPHSFYFPEPKYEHVFDDVEVNYPHSSFKLDDKPEWIQKRLRTWHGIYGPIFDWRKEFPDDKASGVIDFARMVRAYWGTILSVDDSVGHLLAFLEQQEALDNTMFIFMGDNGLLEGEHGMVDKRTAHEASIRVPMIIRYPGWTKWSGPVRVQQQVLTTDVAPTILDAAGAEAMNDLHGASVKPLIAGDDQKWRREWLYYYNYEKQFPYTPNVRAVRGDRFKYIRYPHGDGSDDRHMAELYDIENDPEESTNLINDPEYASTVAEMQQRLIKSMQAVGIDPAKDEMPIDAGIGTKLPDKAIR